MKRYRFGEHVREVKHHHLMESPDGDWIELSSPSGMVRVEKCNHDILSLKLICPTCKGTGEILTDISVGEAMELLKKVVQCQSGFPERETCDVVELMGVRVK